MARCMLCVLLVVLALLPLFLPPHCHAYPLSLAKFLQRHRRTLHRLAQIRRRDGWDDGFSHFAEPAPPVVPPAAPNADDDPFQSKGSDFDPFKDSGDTFGGFGDGGFGDGGFGGFGDDGFDPVDDGWGDFVDTGGFGDLGNEDTDFGGFADEGFGHFLDTPVDDDDGFGGIEDYPAKDSHTFSETVDKAGKHSSFTPYNNHGGYVNKGFNSVLPSRSKVDSKTEEWSKYKPSHTGLNILEKILKCDRVQHSCWSDSDCRVCGALYSCTSLGACKVVSSPGKVESSTDDEGREWFDGGYFADAPFDFGDVSKRQQ